MKEMISPQERQRKLYDFMIEWTNSEVGDEFIPKEWIVNSLKEIYPRHLEECHEVDSTVYSNLRKDIRAINCDEKYNYIIVSSAQGYKLADEEELQKYLGKKYKTALRMLKLIHILEKKASLDGQFTINEEIVESFIDKENK